MNKRIPVVKQPYNDPDVPVYEAPNIGGYLVDTAGYIPKEVQLGLLQSAGKSLDDYYRDRYPGNPQLLDLVPRNYSEDVDPPYNPTARKDFDVFAAREVYESICADYDAFVQTIPPSAGDAGAAVEPPQVLKPDTSTDTKSDIPL